MARGSASKDIITAKILETFKGAFKFDKEIRIPIQENGELVQIKVILTAAKTNVAAGGDSSTNTTAASEGLIPAGESNKITPEEKKEVDDLIIKLGL